MPAPSIRERITAISLEMRDQDVPPSRARELLMEMAGLMANVTKEVVESEIVYASVVNECYTTEEKANRAELKAKATPDYRRLMEAKATEKIVSRTMSSLNTIIRSLDTEMRLSR